MSEALEVVTGPHLAAGGDAIAQAPDGRIVFVTGAAPDERVRIEITQAQKRFLRARVTEVLVPGPSRVEPRCPHFGTCGGCSTQHVSSAAQTESKTSQLVETLRRIGGADLSTVQLDPPYSAAPYGYRTRARLVAAADASGKVRFGYRRRAGHEVIAVQACPILAPALERAVLALARAVTRVRGEEEVELVSDGARVLARVSDRLATDNPALERLEHPRVLRGREEGALELDDPRGKLLLSPAVFAQASAEGNDALVDRVAELIASQLAFSGDVLELYSGSGNFTRVLARRARQVVAVEGASDAVALAKRVAPASVQLEAAAAEDALMRFMAGQRRFDAALVDPPRTGLGPAVPPGIAALGVRALVYVSCDPATFSRDVARLRDAGFALVRAGVFDLYPQTPHTEVVGLLQHTRKAVAEPGLLP